MLILHCFSDIAQLIQRYDLDSLLQGHQSSIIQTFFRMNAVSMTLLNWPLGEIIKPIKKSATLRWPGLVIISVDYR